MKIKEAKEILECSEKFSYFCEHYINLIHPDDVFVPFKLYDLQEKLIESIENNDFLIGTKQNGFTTVTIVYSLWKCLFNEKTNIMHIGDNNAFNIIEFAIDLLPPLFKSKIKNTSKNNVIFSNGSKIYFRTLKTCQEDVNILFVNDASFIKNISWDHLPEVNKCYVFSAFNEFENDNWFNRLYQETLQGQNDFQLFEEEELLCT